MKAGIEDPENFMALKMIVLIITIMLITAIML